MCISSIIHSYRRRLLLLGTPDAQKGFSVADQQDGSQSLLVEIRPEDPRPIYVQIMDEVRRAIAVRDVEPDDPLPSVRELAAELRVNPNTVSQAYRALEDEGTVYVRRGRGTFVAADAGPGDQREVLARGVAERALRDAHRHGMSPRELIRAIRVEANRGNTGGRREAGREDDPRHEQVRNGPDGPTEDSVTEQTP